MELHAKKPTIIRPAEETPNHRLWLSNLDMFVTQGHVPTVHFYPFSSDFFELCTKLKQALSKVLVAFYPVAGRFAKDENGRLEIDCNAEGVLFIEAQTTYVIDDLGDFSTSFKLSQFVPKLETSMDISTYPLLVVQVTSFKCGGVCLGIGLDHALADGTSAAHFINTWAAVARGLPVSIPPFIDRTILRTMTPPYPTLDHTEYNVLPSMTSKKLQSNLGSSSTSIASLTISLDQIKTLKVKLREAPIALAGEIQSKPLIFTVKIIHEALKRRDDEYLRSGLAYLEQNPDVVANFNQGGHSFKYPNLKIVSWTRMPLYDADFGLGRPIFVGRAAVPFEGAIYILPSPSKDNTLSLILCLETHEMELFKKFFYDF